MFILSPSITMSHGPQLFGLQHEQFSFLIAVGLQCELLPPKKLSKPTSSHQSKNNFQLQQMQSEQLQMAKLKAYFFLGNSNTFNHLKLHEVKKSKAFYCSFFFSFAQLTPAFLWEKGRDYGAQGKINCKISLGWPTGKKKRHCTPTVSCPHLAVPIPEVKPGKPNLSAQAGKLHAFWDGDQQHRIPSRCVLRDVTCARV